MLEFLKKAYTDVVAALTSNGEHRASLSDFVTATHNVVVDVESRVTALEQAANPVAAAFGGADQVSSWEARIAALEAKIAAGFSVAQTVAPLVDGVAGAVTGAVQVETKPAQ